MSFDFFMCPVRAETSQVYTAPAPTPPATVVIGDRWLHKGAGVIRRKKSVLKILRFKEFLEAELNE